MEGGGDRAPCRRPANRVRAGGAGLGEGKLTLLLGHMGRELEVGSGSCADVGSGRGGTVAGV